MERRLSAVTNTVFAPTLLQRTPSAETANMVAHRPLKCDVDVITR